MKKITHLAAAFCVAVLLTPDSHAQSDLYIGDTNPETAVTTNFTSGTNAYANIYVGLYNDNTLNVYNAGTRLTYSGSLSVGISSAVAPTGSSNRLVISNGGVVAGGVKDNGFIGNSASSVNNSVLVTGEGSVWSSGGSSGGGIWVGSSGSGNSLVISNGGRVQSGTPTIGSASTASNNSVLVTETGSVWSNSFTLTVGSSGSGNSLVISNGGRVRNSSGIIGSSSTASNNSVLVTGAGSTWTNTSELRVGGSGTGTLTVSDGGSVVATNVLIGQNADSAGTLNIGRFGTNDAAGTISAPTIAFGNSTNARAINFNQSNATTISAVISGNGSVNQLGSGTTTLSASNTYTGATTVSGGGLLVSGSIASSAVTVQSGGMLGGSGTVGAVTVQSGGTINPGSSPGTLNINGDIDWLGGGNYNWQIAAVTGTAGTVSTWDLVSATGILDLTALTAGSKFNINLWSLVSTGPDVSGAVPGFDNTQNYTWKIATAAGGITGFNSSFFNLNTGANNGTGGFANGLNGGTFSLAQSGNDLNLVFTAAGGPGPSPVPEPGTWAAAALLVGGAAFMRWRKRAKVA